MTSKREEERNEKIVRGLMKLPPNRRCINCNSLGPQYVCTNFWTFVCITCSGIHREFTHRVKSVSMAKFTSQEVDALQKGGNQRARELLLKAWDMQKNRLPDNSNIDKVREFIKNVYVDKKYALEKSSDRPPRDPQSLRSHEEETRRASSYHSYSKSPPYDFQYEERRYGKHAPALTRKPGSSEFPQLHTVLHNSDANNRSNGGKTLHLQRTESSGSYGSFDSSSMRPVNSLGSPEVVPKPEQTAEISHDRSSSLPSLPQSSASRTFDGLDFFSAAFAPQDITSTPPTGSQSELPQSSVAYSVNFVDQSPISSVSTFTEQQPSQILQSLPLDLFSALPQQQSAASNGKACDAVVPNSGGWATFDMPQNAVPMGTENSAPAVVPSSDGNIKGNFNPFSIYQSCSYQDSAGHETSASTHTFGHAGIQNVGATINNTHLWTAFEDSAGSQPIQNMLKNNEQAALPSALDADNSLGFGDFNDDGNVRTTVETEPPSSSLSPNFSTALNDFPVADMHSFVNVHKPINPFDLHFDSELKSSDMSQFWDMSSLQAALPSAPKSPSYTIGGGNQSWVPQNSLPSYVPGVTFDPTTGSLGFIAGQAPSAQIPNIHAQGPVASVGGNPFA